MENQDAKTENGSVNSSKGSAVPKGQPQNEKNEIKEGDSNQQRPKHGADGGENTSSREHQLPALDNKGADADSDKLIDEKDDQLLGSDADKDRGGQSSI